MHSNWQLVPFRDEWSVEILGWTPTDLELRNWANLIKRPDNAAIFTDWHTDPNTRLFVLLCDNVPVAYGEIWIDAEAAEVELGRIVVKPPCRRMGTGQKLVTALLAEAAQSGLTDAYLRVRPGNDGAIACYERVGFQRVRSEAERQFNQRQPLQYLWYHRELTAE